MYSKKNSKDKNNLKTKSKMEISKRRKAKMDYLMYFIIATVVFQLLLLSYRLFLLQR